jgi:hypothetical protein
VSEVPASYIIFCPVRRGFVDAEVDCPLCPCKGCPYWAEAELRKAWIASRWRVRWA